MIDERHTRRLGSVAIILAVVTIFSAMFYVFATDTERKLPATNETLYTKNVFDKNSVIEMNIVISEDNLSNLFENAAQEEYVLCDIEINGVKYQNAAIRAKGNSSLSMVSSSDSDRYSFKVKFDEYVSGTTLDGLSKINLNNMIGDYTYMKEYLSYDMFSYLGVQTPAFAFANIKINGEEWGGYLAIEAIEEEFIERYFGAYGVTNGNLYKPETMEMGSAGKGGNNANNAMPNFDSEDMQKVRQRLQERSNQTADADISDTAMPQQPADIGAGGNAAAAQAPMAFNNAGKMNGGMGRGGANGANLVYTDGEISSYSAIFDSAVFNTTDEKDNRRVIEMIKNLNDKTDIEKYLDVENVLKYFAVNTFIVNLDGYASNMKHNYYLYELDGKCYILPWDFNLAFGGFNSGDASSVINFPIDAPYTDSAENSPLISKLLEIDEYKELYHSYLRDLAENYAAQSTTMIDKLDSLIGEAVKEDATSFTDYDSYKAAAEQLKLYMQDRSKSILAQLDGTQSSTEYGDIQTELDLKAMGTMGMGKGGDRSFNRGNPVTAENTQANTGTAFAPAAADENIAVTQADVNEDTVNAQSEAATQNDVPAASEGVTPPAGRPQTAGTEAGAQNNWRPDGATGGPQTAGTEAGGQNNQESDGATENQSPNNQQFTWDNGQFPENNMQGQMTQNPFQSTVGAQSQDGENSAPYFILGISFGVMCLGLVFALLYRPKKYRFK